MEHCFEKVGETHPFPKKCSSRVPFALCLRSAGEEGRVGYNHETRIDVQRRSWVAPCGERVSCNIILQRFLLLDESEGIESRHVMAINMAVLRRLLKGYFASTYMARKEAREHSKAIRTRATPPLMPHVAARLLAATCWVATRTRNPK